MLTSWVGLEGSDRRLLLLGPIGVLPELQRQGIGSALVRASLAAARSLGEPVLLLEGNPAPTELETRQALCGNLCRCSGYRGVVDAVKDVVAEREAHGAADAETHTDEARIPHQAGPGAGGVNASAFESPRSAGVPGPHDQAYGQDGGQA